MTSPWPVALARPTRVGAIEALVAATSAGDLPVPGVVGGVPEVHEFAASWSAVTGMRPTTRRSEGVYALDHVGGGHPRERRRPARDRGRRHAAPTLDGGFRGRGAPPRPRGRRRRPGDRGEQLRGLDAGFWVWEDRGRVVWVARYGGPTPNGIRIGPILAAERRGHGYATALVAELSAWLLAGGRRFCFLYTDLANPTSNAIYRRIGYRQVCDSANIAFEPPA